MIEFLPAREVAVDIFGWQIHWYGLLYLAAFTLAWYLLPRLMRQRGIVLARGDWLFVLTLGMAGVLLGGRLGFVLFYEPGYFAAHPEHILALWRGGMSWHGGMIGVGLAMWLAARTLKIDGWALVDVTVIVAALGVAVGRVGNVINGEIFIGPVMQTLAVTLNLLLAAVLYWYWRKGEGRPGRVTALFLLLAGIIRFGMEYFRVQQYGLILGLTRGQILSLLIIGAGGLLMIWRQRRRAEQN